MHPYRLVHGKEGAASFPNGEFDTRVGLKVRGYDRGALDDDYRWSALWHIATPVWQASINIPPVIWWNNLERILLAVDDLGCRDLLV